MVAELDGANALVSRFVYADRENTPAYMLKGGGAFRFICHTRGSVRLVVNALTGVVGQRLDYDAYSRVLTDTAPGFQPFGFAGGLYDPLSGLVHFGERDYDPEAGRWSAKDPLVEAQRKALKAAIDALNGQLASIAAELNALVAKARAHGFPSADLGVFTPTGLH